MSKHTPGPWTAICPDKRYFYEGTDITKYDVLTVKTRAQLLDEGHTHYRSDPGGVDNVSIVSSHFWNDMTADEAKANASLIAAAPDLLEALEKAVARQGFSNDELISAREVIAKAKGEA